MPHAEKSYKYIPLPKYPHMRPADVEIWRRFLLANPERFLRVWYDFRVGSHAHDCENCLDCSRTGWFDLTRWACDVIAEDNENFYTIEIKPAANAKALGQTLAYSILFLEEHKPSKPVIPVVLTDHIIESTRRVAEIQGIELWQA